MGKGDTLLNAVIGAVVTILLSFTGIAPVLGGAVAGYLQRETRKGGAKVGALSGAIAFLPVLLFLFVAVGFFTVGPMMGGGFGMGIPGGLELLVVGLILFPLFVLWHVGLGALGGYLGAYVREEW